MSHNIDLSERAERVIAGAAAQQGMSFEEYLRRILESLIDRAWEEKPSLESDALLRPLRLQVRHIRSFDDFGDVDESNQQQASYDTEDWFRHLGATEEDIREARRLSGELFPAEDESEDTPPAVDHANTR